MKRKKKRRRDKQEKKRRRKRKRKKRREEKRRKEKGIEEKRREEKRRGEERREEGDTPFDGCVRVEETTQPRYTMTGHDTMNEKGSEWKTTKYLGKFRAQPSLRHVQREHA